MKTIPLLLCDFYKTVHSEQYPKNLTKMVSYFTPRMSRLDGKNEIVMFGLQYFIKEYLIDYFNENFFNRSEEEIINEYNRILGNALGVGTYDDNKIKRLHKLGYLPLRIRAIKEGSRVGVHIPMIEISNTHPDFPWLTNAIETLMSCTLWHTMISATVGMWYRSIVNSWYNMTVDDNVPRNKSLGDFSMRGQESLESAIKSSAAFCLSFLNTATVPTIPWLEEYYNCDCTKEPVAYGAISTEHSVACSNFVIDGDEITFIKRILTEIYPNNSFSFVADSYDYWNLIANVLPQCKEEIMKHNGTFLIRPDSGVIEDILCGTKVFEEFRTFEDMAKSLNKNSLSKEKYAKFNGEYWKVWLDENSKTNCENYIPTPEDFGTVELLWNEFGGDINSKGYKVLDPKVKAIYGDGVTLNRCEEVYRRLERKGFAANNVVLGVGSFSMQCIETTRPDKVISWNGIDAKIVYPENILQPFTRDSFGIAIKATYCEDDRCNPIFIFKNPKTDTEGYKKSQKGCCIVQWDEKFGYQYSDGHTFKETFVHYNELREVFINGKMTKEYSLKEIRDLLWKGEF